MALTTQYQNDFSPRNADQSLASDWFDQYATPPAETVAAPTPTGAQPSYADFQRDYWAPDREQVLASMAPAAMTGAAANAPDFGQFWMQSGGRTVADLKARAAEWNAAHPNDPVTLGGSKGDKPTYRGQTYDAVIAAGLGGQGASWNAIGGSTAGAVGGAGWAQGDFTKPFTGQYQLPSLADLQAMPGYQAGLDAATQAVQRSAAANGTLLTGGLQRRLGQVANDYAQQQYGNLANLKLGEFGTNRDIAYRNQDAPFAKLSSLAVLGKP